MSSRHSYISFPSIPEQDDLSVLTRENFLKKWLLTLWRWLAPCASTVLRLVVEDTLQWPNW